MLKYMMRDRDGIYGDRFRHRQPLRRCQVDGIGDAMATALSRCLASGTHAKSIRASLPHSGREE